MRAAPVLSVDRLSVDYRDADAAWLNVIDDVSVEILPGEIVGLAGESGCGKSTVASVALGERPHGRRQRGGTVTVAGTDVGSADPRTLQSLRGRVVAFVPQNPAQGLTPSMPVGQQVVEVLATHGVAQGSDAWRRTLDLFADVGLPAPETTARKLPFQLSGGQQQRVVLAMAIACRPAVLVLDEPTTGLDVTTQSRILALLVDLRDRYGIGMLYISHDLAAMSQLCDRLYVMYAGHIVETGPTDAVFAQPRHPYTRGLIASVPNLDGPPDPAAMLSGSLRRGDLPAGCRFAPRCTHALPRCAEQPQALERTADGHAAACWRWRTLMGGH